MTEFNLSKKIVPDRYSDVIGIEDVKEFIRRLKEKLGFLLPANRKEVIRKIDKLAGEELGK